MLGQRVHLHEMNCTEPGSVWLRTVVSVVRTVVRVVKYQGQFGKELWSVWLNTRVRTLVRKLVCMKCGRK